MGILAPQRLMPTRTYSPGELKISAGFFPVVTFNSVKIGFNSPMWRFYKGTQGEIARGKTLDKLATIEIVIPRTDITNDLLSAQMLVTDTIPVFIKDNLGLSFCHMSKATIQRIPTHTFGKEVTDNTWRFTGRLNLNWVGGNSFVAATIRNFLDPTYWVNQIWN